MSCLDRSFHASMLCLVVFVLPASFASFMIVTILVAAGGFGDREKYVAASFGALILVVLVFIAASVALRVRAKRKAAGVSLEDLSTPEKSPLIAKQ